ncbi:MAG: DUF6431 domain-containing protein, partial [Actinomycetota bacterium]|nr:DUF6431 domain-containing protein [Actinomycetota bacterium]
MAIVWVCALSVDEYVAAGRAVAVPRPDCPTCSAAMVFWSGYERSVRHAGPARKLWFRRARCRRCQASHALVPSFCLVGRLDAVDVIGLAVTAVVGEGHGVRPVAAATDVPHTTARDWVRRFCRRAEAVVAAFAALVVELAGRAPCMSARATPGELALAMIRTAFAVV